MPLTTLAEGTIRKMVVTHRVPVEYALPIGTSELALNPLLGRRITMRFNGAIQCIYCARKIRKSYAQGYCYPCFRDLAQCDLCVLKPELCHYDKGTCRDPAWGERECMTAHTLYLANSSGLKVGLTQGLCPVRRWIDQGATQGLAIRTLERRKDAGLMEAASRSFVADRTNWRKMLSGIGPHYDLCAERDRLLGALNNTALGEAMPGKTPEEAQVVQIEFPVLVYPQKVVAHSFNRCATLEGSLLGIKGQYLIFDAAVVNVRSLSGCHFELAIAPVP